MCPVFHSNRIRDEHEQYLKNLEKIITKRTSKSNRKLSYDFYKMSYSVFVLISELIKKRQNTPYLNELKTEVVTLIGLGTIGFETSLHLRRCIELILKHIYYLHHPIEYQILTESIETDNISKEDITVRELFDYLSTHPSFKISRKLNDPINILNILYRELCEIVHARKTSIPSKLEQCTLPKLLEDDVQHGKKTYQKIMKSIIILLVIFHRKSVSKFDEFIKEAILYSLSPTVSRNLRTKLSI